MLRNELCSASKRHKHMVFLRYWSIWFPSSNLRTRAIRKPLPEYSLWVSVLFQLTLDSACDINLNCKSFCLFNCKGSSFEIEFSCNTYSYVESKKAKIIQTECRMVVARGREVREMERHQSKDTTFHKMSKFWTSSIQLGDYSVHTVLYT